MSSLMNVINADARQLVNNRIIQSMTVIDWGKAMARANEIIQKELLIYSGLEAFDPELDTNCPEINTKNNSPGFDILVKNKNGDLKRVQSKLRQVRGKDDFSHQTHFETTRRHSKKNEGASSDSGHVAYSPDEFDYVMVSLINVRTGLDRRNNIDLWSFSIIPIAELVDSIKGCCFTHIPSKLLDKYKYRINSDSPPDFS
tara:strand:+ start:88 stop:687 length:600 start_codon:yes stop_codon:yes gene_type:complete